MIYLGAENATVTFSHSQGDVMIKIGSIGYNCSHPQGFVVDWKTGPGAYILLLVKTPAEFRLGQEKFEVKPGTVVVIAPSTPTFYKPAGKEYIDDWFYFEIDGDAQKSLSDLGIPINRPAFIGAGDIFSSMIFEMTVEFYSSELYHEDIVRLYTEIFFKRLSRVLTKKLTYKPGLPDEKRTELANLRARIYQAPASVTSVTALAEEMKISVSGLEHLYKKAFGTPIISDIVNSRVSYAKNLLMSTKMQISEVAERSGYNSCYSFMRQFKQRVGVTPSIFRKFAAYGEWNKTNGNSSDSAD